jgi:hypothetical protein
LCGRVVPGKRATLYFAFAIGNHFIVKNTSFLPDLAVGMNDVLAVL